MRRTRAPGILVLVGLILSVLVLPADPVFGDDDPAAAEGPPPATSVDATAATFPPPPSHDSRRGSGFICERRTTEMAASSASYAVKGTLAVKGASCQDCCQENILFLDGFETGTTGEWSATVP